MGSHSLIHTRNTPTPLHIFGFEFYKTPATQHIHPLPPLLSMFGTQDEAHWRHVRKATAPAFSMANVRCGGP